jgi:hypothetical protein
MIWVGLTVMIATIIISLALLRTWRGDALGIPLVAIGTFGFLYVIQPLQLIRSDSIGLFLSDQQALKALLVPALMLACFMWGWLYPVRRKQRDTAYWNPRTLWNFGLGAAFVGLILYVIFLERSGGIRASFSQAHGGAMDWNKNTAYIYDAPWLLLSGSAMMMISSQRLRSASKWMAYLPYAFLTVFLANAFLGGDRGPLFAGLTAIFVCYSISHFKQIRLANALGLLLFVSFAVAVVFANRDRIHLGSDAPAVLKSPEQTLNELVGVGEVDKEHGTAAQEFLFHAATLETVDQTGKLDWGETWITWLVINPIPRLLWPEKAYPPGPGITTSDIREYTSLAISGGAASGFAADLYMRFHLLSVLFCFGLGYGFRRLFISARTLVSPLASVGYVMIYALSLNMFAQGFSSVFVPFLYSMAPVMLFTWSTRLSQKKVRDRQRELVLRKAALIRGAQWSS